MNKVYYYELPVVQNTLRPACIPWLECLIVGARCQRVRARRWLFALGDETRCIPGEVICDLGRRPDRFEERPQRR